MPENSRPIFSSQQHRALRRALAPWLPGITAGCGIFYWTGGLVSAVIGGFLVQVGLSFICIIAVVFIGSFAGMEVDVDMLKDRNPWFIAALMVGVAGIAAGKHWAMQEKD